MCAHQTHVHSWGEQTGGLNGERAALNSLNSNSSSTCDESGGEDTVKPTVYRRRSFPKSAGRSGECLVKDLENPRLCKVRPSWWEASLSLIQKMENTKKPSNNARRKLEVPMDAAMPCKKGAYFQETVAKSDASNKILKTMFVCIVEAHESTRQRLESSPPKNHEDHITGKGYNSMTHYNLVHKFIPMPQAIRILDAKAAVDKEWKKLETVPAWQLDNVKSKKEVILEAQRDPKRKSTLMDICHLKNAELEPEFQKYKGRVVHRGDIVKGDSGAYAVFTEQGSFALSMTAAKVMDDIAGLPDCTGHAADAASAYTEVKKWKTPKPECPDIWIRLPRHKWPKSWSNNEDPVDPLERQFYRHPLAGFLWWRQFEEVLLGLGWEKYRIGNACSFIGNTDCSCRFMWMTSEWLEERRIWLTAWKKLLKLVDLGEPTSFLDRENVWCTQRECNPNGIIIKEYKERWITNFCSSKWKISRVGETSRKNGRVVRRHGRTCSDMRWALLRIGEQKDRAAIQSFKSLLGWSPFQGGGTWISWRIVKSMLTNYLENLVHGTNW